MSDVAEVKEALEALSRASMERTGDSVRVWPISIEKMRKAQDAARRWVRVVEGLDYEAAARAMQPGLWELILDDPNEEDPPGIRERSIRKATRTVDAAVGVEKETTDG